MALGLQSLVYDNLFLSNRHGIDNYIYTGFILSPHEHYQNFPSTYYGGRLPQIAPGVLLTSIFGDYHGLILSRMAFLLLFAFAMYGWIDRVMGRLAGWIGFALCLTLPEVLYTFSNDYVSQAAMAFTALALLFVEMAATGRGWVRAGWIAACGGAFMATISTNLFLVVIAPALGVYFLFRSRADRRLVSRLLSDAGFGALGMLAVYGLLEAISVSLGNGFHHMLPSIRFATQTGLQPNEWNPVDWFWLLSAFWLVIPGFALVVSLRVLWRAFRTGELKVGGGSGRLAVAAATVVISGIFIAYQLKGNPILVYSVFSILLFPFAIGGVLNHQTLQGAGERLWVGPLAAVSLLVFLLATRVAFGLLLDLNVSSYVVIEGVCVVTAGLLFVRPIPRPAVALGALIFSQVFVIVPGHGSKFSLEYPPAFRSERAIRNHLIERRHEDPAEFAENLVLLHNWIYAGSNGRRMTFLVGSTSDFAMQKFQMALTSTFLWTGPVLELSGALDQENSPRYLVMLGVDDGWAATEVARLEPGLGIELKKVAETTFVCAGTFGGAAMFKIEKISRDAAAKNKRARARETKGE